MNVIEKPININELGDGQIALQMWTKRGDHIVVSALIGDVLPMLFSVQAQADAPGKPSLPEVVVTYLMNHHFSHAAALYSTSLGMEPPPPPDFSNVAGMDDEEAAGGNGIDKAAGPSGIVTPHGFPARR